MIMKFFEIGTRFFISNTFISNAKLKLAKNQFESKSKNTKQHPEAERIHIFHQRHHPKIIEYIQKTRKKTSVSVFMRLYD